MPKPRFSGGSVSMRWSSSQMLPPESCMSPAMQLSAVDLPQPEGPSRQMNSPRLTMSVSSSSALNALPPAPAKRRVTRSSLSSLKSRFIAHATLDDCHSEHHEASVVHEDGCRCLRLRPRDDVTVFLAVTPTWVSSDFQRLWIPACAGMTHLYSN